MTHWCAQYIGQPWTEEQDCLWWFRFWAWVHFGVDVPAAAVRHESLTQSAARLMGEGVTERFGYRRVEAPEEGDAVFLSQRNRPHHVGMAVIVDGQQMVLHALDGVGVVLSDSHELRLSGWVVTSYWRYNGHPALP